MHGILAGRSLWRPNLDALARVARPVVVELWGHGRSPAPEDPALYTPQAYVDAFEWIRRELGAERWLVCGQSLGGALTLRYTLTHPDRVIAQIFTNATSALGDREWVERTRIGTPALAGLLESGGRAALERLPMHTVHARRMPAEARAALLEDAALLDPYAVARTLRYTAPEASSRERIAEIHTPTLLVCGEREKRFRRYRDFAAQQMPAIEVVDADGGHAVNVEAPEAFDAAVVAFIRRVSGPRPTQ